ncbi:MarC family protein [Alcaligenes sp. WGS1538]|uniref:MarC family protein n=1 Tax=Alcaligenes sp. WGS1538 TaxID=3366811 RepID=UPI00372D736C
MEFPAFLADLSRSFLFALATLLPMLNPPAAAPIFLTLTEGASTPDRARLAQKVSINIFVMLAIATVAGNIVLNFFGISLPIIRVGGGLLVIATAWRLVNASDFDAAHAQNMAESYSWEQIRSKAFYPLTFPMICGPGSISAALTVGATLHDNTVAGTAGKLAGAVPAIAVAGFVVYLCLRFASQFLYKLGKNGTAVVMRLSAFILLCLGVQIAWAGFHELFLGLLHEASTFHSTTSS